MYMKAIEFDNMPKTCYPFAIVSNKVSTMRTNYNRNDDEKILAKYPNLDIKLAKNKYWAHKNYAKVRVDINGNTILFLLTFEEWIDIWIASGKWHLRGRGKGKYCMSRFNDIGHYEVGNVYINEFTKNAQEGTINNGNNKNVIGYKGNGGWNKGIPHKEETKAKMSAAKTGKSTWNKGKPAWNKGIPGKPWSDERRAKAKSLKER